MPNPQTPNYDPRKPPAKGPANPERPDEKGPNHPGGTDPDRKTGQPQQPL